MPDKIRFDVEYTDTMGGEANYCWVKRETVFMEEGHTDRQLVTAAKKALGLSGVRTDNQNYGDMIKLVPRGSATVVFINFSDRPYFEVVVGNVGSVYKGNDEVKANEEYDAWVKSTVLDGNRAKGEAVTLFEDGEPKKEHDAAESE
jgi:hypothetical protein